ncbi:zinc finger 804A, partial [Pelobates cultripes]
SSVAPLPMECYYIVISSSHLSKGHFRNIKGVFRGPLTDSKTLRRAEAQAADPRCLRDDKANFYCELCDKQYHKHQQFDNHINSYDHAHKQRLKELKQREFARNVASKLRKNERKQKKHLERLHKLADLRREATCAPGSGPMFKSTTVTVRDHICESLQSAIVRSVDKEESNSAPFNGSSVMSVLLSSSESSKNNTQCVDDQIKQTKEHRVSFSFAFPKRTPLKLESSAAVFYEFNDEIISEHEVKNQRNLVTESLITQSIVPTQCLKEEIQPATVLENHTYDEGLSSMDTNQKLVQETELTNCLKSEACPVKVPLDFGASVKLEAHMLLKQMPSTEDLENVQMTEIISTSETINGKSTSEDCFSSDLDHSKKPENTMFNKFENCTTLVEDLTKNVSNSISSTCIELDTSKAQMKCTSHRRLSEAFHPVKSRDGSRVLQWPSEMLMDTCTQPSISYSCNPLYFDFKASKTTECRGQSKNLQCGQDREFFHQCDKNRSHPQTVTEFKTKCDGQNDGSQSTKHSRNKSYDLTNCQNNLKCCGLICSIKQNEKNIISKYYLAKDDSMDPSKGKNKTKVNRKSIRKCENRKHQRQHIHIVKMPKIRCRKKCRIFCNTKSLEKPTVESKDSLCSIKKLTNTNQMPHTEQEHIQEFLRIPTLHIKKECRIWNVQSKKEFNSYSEKEPGKNIVYSSQSEQLTLNKDSNDRTNSETLCSWNVEKTQSTLQKHEIFLNKSCSVKRVHTSVIDETHFACKRPRLCKPISSSVPRIIFPIQKLSAICEHLWIKSRQAGDIRPDGNINRGPCSKSLYAKSANDMLANNSNQSEITSFRAAEFLQKIEKFKKVVENKIDQLCKSLFDFTDRKQTQLFCTGNIPETETNVRNPLASIKQKDVLPEGKIIEQNKQHESGIPSLPCSNRKSEPCIMKSHLSDKLAGEVYNESRRNCIKWNTETLSTQPSPCNEKRINSQTFISEKLLSHVGLTYQDTFFPPKISKRHKYHQCGAYRHTLRHGIMPSKLRLIIPTIAVQSCASLYPVQLEQPFCSASVATVQPTLLQHPATDAFAATSVENVKLVDPPQHFVQPQCHVFSRTPFYQIAVEPTFCPSDTFISSPQVPVLQNSMFCHIPVPFPQVSHASVFPIIHPPHPPLIQMHHLL